MLHSIEHMHIWIQLSKQKIILRMYHDFIVQKYFVFCYQSEIATAFLAGKVSTILVFAMQVKYACYGPLILQQYVLYFWSLHII